MRQKRAFTLKIHLYKVLKQTKLFYGDGNQIAWGSHTVEDCDELKREISVVMKCSAS